MIKLYYFARIREALGLSDEEIDYGVSSKDVKSLLDHLKSRGGSWAEILSDPNHPVLVAVNQELVKSNQQIKDGDEVALFPPVTGG